MAVDRSPRADAVAAIAADTARGAHTTVPRAARGARALGHGRVVVGADQETESLSSQGLDYLRTLEAHFAGVPVAATRRIGRLRAEIARRDRL